MSRILNPKIQAPPAPPPPPAPSDPAVNEAVAAERNKGRSRAATILTGGAGASSEGTQLARKSLLGS